MAPAVRTFLHQQNFSGKTVIPFMTNGGWSGHTIADMKTACRGAAFAHEKEIQFDSNGGDHLETPMQEIKAWLPVITTIFIRFPRRVLFRSDRKSVV